MFLKNWEVLADFKKSTNGDSAENESEKATNFMTS